jgi:hypothetical protein
MSALHFGRVLRIGLVSCGSSFLYNLFICLEKIGGPVYSMKLVKVPVLVVQILVSNSKINFEPGIECYINQAHTENQVT